MLLCYRERGVREEEELQEEKARRMCSVNVAPPLVRSDPSLSHHAIVLINQQRPGSAQPADPGGAGSAAHARRASPRGLPKAQEHDGQAGHSLQQEAGRPKACMREHSETKQGEGDGEKAGDG
jgi:hypothetical protein